MFKRKKVIILFLFVITSFFICTNDPVAGKIRMFFANFDRFPFVREVIIKKYTHMKEWAHKQRIDLPSSGVKEVIKDVVGGASTSPLASVVPKAVSSTLPSSYSLKINPSEPDARVRIMNIEPVYNDGIKVKKGDYRIAVDKPGFRPKQFWVTVGEDPSRDVYQFDVELQPVGLEDCENNVEMQRYNSGTLGLEGRLFQYKAYFKDTNIHDLYYSFMSYKKTLRYSKMLYGRVSPNYAEFHVAGPTHLTEEDIRLNRKVEIDPDRFILGIYSFEQVGDDVVLSNKELMPGGVFVVQANKEWLCENEFVF